MCFKIQLNQHHKIIISVFSSIQYLNHSSRETNIACNAFEDSSGGVRIQAVALIQHFKLFWSDGGSLTFISSVLLLDLSAAPLALKTGL